MSALALCLATATAAYSQGALWLGLQGDLEVTDVVELALSEEVRQEVLPTGVTEVLTEVSARVDLTGGMALQGSYRLGVLPGTSPVGLENRLAADLRLDHRVGDVRLKARQRYQVTFDPTAKHALRTRLGAELRGFDVRPWLSVEPFFRLDDPDWFHKVRFTAGVKVPTQGPDLRVFTHFEQYATRERLVVLGLRATLGGRLGG